MKRLAALTLVMLFLAWGFSFAQQDSIIIGATYVNYGENHAEVPIYFVTFDTVGFFNLPLGWSSLFEGITPDSIQSFLPWDLSYDTVITSEDYFRILGFCDLYGGPPPMCLSPDGARQHTLTAHFTIDPMALPQTVELDSTYDQRHGSTIFGLIDGITEVFPVVIKGGIEYGGCPFVPGDANNDEIYNGIDVGYCVNYLKGGLPPEEICYCQPYGRIYPSADANGNCHFDGIDVTYSINYLKGMGDAPRRCVDCPEGH